MNDDKQLRESYYNFFKEQFNIDLKGMPLFQAKILIDELNKELDSMIINEEKKNQSLLNDYHNMYNDYRNMYNEYIKLSGQLTSMINMLDNE